MTAGFKSGVAAVIIACAIRLRNDGCRILLALPFPGSITAGESYVSGDLRSGLCPVGAACRLPLAACRLLSLGAVKYPNYDLHEIIHFTPPPRELWVKLRDLDFHFSSTPRADKKN